MQHRCLAAAAGFAFAIALGAAPLLAEQPASFKKSECTTLSKACMIEVARTHVDARTDDRVRPVLRVSPNLHRWENGVLTTDKGEELLDLNAGGDTTLLGSREKERVFVQDNNVIFFWLIDSKLPEHPGTVHLVHRIQVEGGKDKCGAYLSPCITEIETIWCRSDRAMEESRPAAKEPGLKFSCDRGTR